MQSFGRVAVRAANLYACGEATSPQKAWRTACDEAFPHSASMREKCCPKAAFLGLCEEGLVKEIPPGRYTRSRENKAYAIRAAAILVREPAVRAGGSRVLWNRVIGSGSKIHNSQMDVVLALHDRGLLAQT